MLPTTVLRSWTALHTCISYRNSGYSPRVLLNSLFLSLCFFLRYTFASAVSVGGCDFVPLGHTLSQANDNKISDMRELQKLSGLCNLQVAFFQGNPIAQVPRVCPLFHGWRTLCPVFPENDCVSYPLSFFTVPSKGVWNSHVSPRARLPSLDAEAVGGMLAFPS